jgi:hypothetical protein
VMNLIGVLERSWDCGKLVFSTSSLCIYECIKYMAIHLIVPDLLDGFCLYSMFRILYFSILLHCYITRSHISVSNGTQIVHSHCFILKSH